MDGSPRLACRRCRLRKQRCSHPRPCTNCVQAHATCVPSQRSSRRSNINPEYARALEERIQELEAQDPPEHNPVQVAEAELSTALPIGRRRQTSRRTDRSIRPSPAPSPSVELRSAASTPSLGLIPSLTLPSPNQCIREAHESGIPPQTQDQLIRIFLERVNPRYPFLHEETFNAWYATWKTSRCMGVPLPAEERWKAVFVKMAFAVSLLIAPRVSQDDMDTSQALYSSSLSSLDTVFACLDPVLHAQAYLLCTLHALHSPSSQTVLTMISAAMRCCVTAQLHLAIPDRKAGSSLLEMQIRRRVFWSAYAIDRLISWVYHVPCSLVDGDIQVEPFANMNDEELKAWSGRLEPVASTPRRTQVSSALHLIRGRRIQSRILSVMMRADYDQRFAGSHSWRLHMLEILDQWKSQLQPHSDPLSEGYTSEGWVGMLYNYTVLLLYRPTQANIGDLVAERCLKACTDIALTFWRYLKSRQTAQLWPGLLGQFGIGITLLYCLWVTPPSNRSAAFQSPKVGTAIRTCSVILAVLSERWTQAEPLRDVFDLLADAIPAHPPTQAESQLPTSTILSQMPRIHALVVNKDILRMLTEMSTEYPEHRPNLSPWASSDRHVSADCPLCWGGQSAGANFPLPGGDCPPEGFVPNLWPAFDPSPSSQSWTMAGGESPFFPGLLGSIEF
ncbi:hypothetical protein BO71DRAFT_485573 [Aspergillus ellipticus CBS 707.79]|uniref:Zn(2)-C6 fungal-type domain-containing protein n=1 Tax=Aspergillus ellipticus CBS 707.79 TaxID=1448320 RepID=A0A319D498_9EURO|nr:hypothetical protein BO71DRAFT_485573 [Aspergillus ellipticus CBS 707.79]